jgi:hypothetical protein
MKDNFDLKKFLLENKALQNLNPILGKESLNEGDLRSKIKEMILTELGNNPDYSDFDEFEDTYDDESTYYSHTMDLEDDELENSLMDKYDMIDNEKDLYEAKDDEEEDVEDVEVEDTEEITPDDAPSDETGGGLEDIAADMEGNEGELMNHLMSALKMAKGMNNEKLETQIGNTLKFFVSEYIGGGE